ncbi:hypothetical protein BDZ45DRAFT_743847 [Acephala macrosclerotiorum]|nr:hypothetical protein BDZ45DRAFT_743847 [Acephala macrosclerotiorum]
MVSNNDHAAACLPLSKLSLDVFAIIADFLEVSDIQSARLAGRDLHFFLSPYLFRAVTFAPHQESLDRLSKISQDPALSFNTRTLRYDTSIFRLPNSKHEFDELE